MFPLSEQGAAIFTGLLFLGVLIMWARQGWWHLLQGIVFLAVFLSNIRWQWTPNGLLAGGIAVGAAFAVTWVASTAYDLIIRLRANRNAKRFAPRPVISEQRKSQGAGHAIVAGGSLTHSSDLSRRRIK